MSKSKSKSSKSTKRFRALDYKHSITVRHGHGGRIVSTIVGTDSLNTWTRATKRRIDGVTYGPGLTVRTDNVQTVRLSGDIEVVSDNRS